MNSKITIVQVQKTFTEKLQIITNYGNTKHLCKLTNCSEMKSPIPTNRKFYKFSLSRIQAFRFQFIKQ